MNKKPQKSNQSTKKRSDQNNRKQINLEREAEGKT